MQQQWAVLQIDGDFRENLPNNTTEYVQLLMNTIGDLKHYPPKWKALMCMTIVRFMQYLVSSSDEWASFMGT